MKLPIRSCNASLTTLMAPLFDIRQVFSLVYSQDFSTVCVTIETWLRDNTVTRLHNEAVLSKQGGTCVTPG